jgi:L-asparagine transporter-like permease
MQMWAATIWLCLAVLWIVDAGFAFHRRDLRQGFVAAVVAICFLAASLYFSAKRPRRMP